MEKVKLLCLHGYRQDSESFRSKTGSLRKLLKKDATLTYISAPYITGNENERSWWFSNRNHSFASTEVTDFAEGLETSAHTVDKAVEEFGPFDGIIGFSQGAAMAALYCILMENNNKRFKFAILVAGFKSLAAPHTHFYEKYIHIPSLHIIGDTDQVVNKCKSEELSEIFEGAVVLHHQGGHYVPTSGSVLKSGYIDFISKFKQAKES